MAFEVMTGTSPAVVAVGQLGIEGDTVVLFEGEHERVPIVCSMVVVCPVNCI